MAFLEEPAIQFVVRENGQSLVHVAERFHDAALHQKASAANRSRQAKQIPQPMLVRSIVGAEHGLLPERPQTELALARKPPDALHATVGVHVFDLNFQLVGGYELIGR